MCANSFITRIDEINEEVDADLQELKTVATQLQEKVDTIQVTVDRILEHLQQGDRKEPTEKKPRDVNTTRRTLVRPFVVVNNRRQAQDLSTDVLRQFIALHFFAVYEEELCGNAMTNIMLETTMIIQEIITEEGISLATAWSSIDPSIQKKYALMLEVNCKAFDVHFDQCVNSWATSLETTDDESSSSGDDEEQEEEDNSRPRELGHPKALLGYWAFDKGSWKLTVDNTGKVNTATRLFIRDNVFTSAVRAPSTSFVKFTCWVNTNNAPGMRNAKEQRQYLGTVKQFFSHQFEGDHRLLVLAEVYKTEAVTGHPWPRMTENSQSKYKFSACMTLIVL
ncbi:hypothetical protein BDB00DRAFT_786921 [Zychaea mexicana]|uniref:uncharacterized protein n=1 Tax=Zychaea mexicana TaxID=64656 RepID=UPI0022FDE271|nr:uncharacterized protein BDB00DRAFT_786921 [Zychaea mexicana]KAI9494818.1 hypothetical protein BDB00DRAFT_786921 [Zychaea mexicana]